jgi:hypothetical protein
MQESNTSTHGGARPGAGRKKKEETVTTGFRLNTEALNICRRKYGRTLNSKINEYIIKLANEYNGEDESVKEQVPNEMNMKGYKINVFYETITKEEMDRKSAFVANVVVNSLRKHKKKE